MLLFAYMKGENVNVDYICQVLYSTVTSSRLAAGLSDSLRPTNLFKHSRNTAFTQISPLVQLCSATASVAVVPSLQWPPVKGTVLQVYSTLNKPRVLNLDRPMMDLRLSAVSTSILLILTPAPSWLAFTHYSGQKTDKHMHVYIDSWAAKHNASYKGKVKKSILGAAVQPRLLFL